MKKQFLPTIILVLLLTACTTSIYVFKLNPPYSNINFDKGKWLLNNIESPDFIKPEMTQMVVKTFSKYLKGNLYILNKTDGLILPPKIPLNPNKLILKDIKNGTGFDYFINIKAKMLKNDAGSISFGSPIGQDETRVELTLEVYDLNNLDITYSQTVTGISQLDNDSKGMMLTKGPNSLIIGALRKIMKKIDKNHI